LGRRRNLPDKSSASHAWDHAPQCARLRVNCRFAGFDRGAPLKDAIFGMARYGRAPQPESPPAAPARRLQDHGIGIGPIHMGLRKIGFKMTAAAASNAELVMRARRLAYMVEPASS